MITKEISYFSKQKISSLVKYSECLSKYVKNFDKEISLETESPIFLDTNVLLRYYSISLTAREKLFEFIKNNKHRIVLTSQVQYEFLKNREDVIQRFFEQVTNKIPKDFNSDVVNRMKVFLDLHKVVLKDYPFVETGIQKHQNELEELLKKLNETVENNRKQHIDLIVKDEYLDLLNSCLTCEHLDDNEIEIIRKDFDFLVKSISLEQLDSVMNKPNFVFPGLGDIKNKPDDPYGDYIIYHEILKFILAKKVDVIFLTFDTTKGDWMSKAKTPHLHYVQNMYSNTNQILYILDAERTLGSILNINIESLVVIETPVTPSDQISIESLEKLAESHILFKRSKPVRISSRLIDELLFAGYKSMRQLRNDLDKCSIAYQEYIKDRGSEFNYLGTYRIALRISNPDYKYSFDANGEKKLNLDSTKMELEKYRKFLLK